MDNHQPTKGSNSSVFKALEFLFIDLNINRLIQEADELMLILYSVMQSLMELLGQKFLSLPSLKNSNKEL